MVDIKKGVKVCKIHVIKCNCFKRNLGNDNTNFFKLIFGYCLHACKIPLLYLIQSRLLFCSFSACLHFLWFAIKVKVGDLCNKVMIIYIQFSVLYSENGCFFFYIGFTSLSGIMQCKFGFVLSLIMIPHCM